jgi:hypothetical protein
VREREGKVRGKAKPKAFGDQFSVTPFFGFSVSLGCVEGTRVEGKVRAR